MNSLYFTLFALLSVAASGQIVNIPATNSNNNPALVPVSSLDVPSFLGRFMIMYTNQLPLNTFMKDAFCAVKDFTLMNGASVATWVPTNVVTLKDVLSFNVGSPTGSLTQIDGTLTNNQFLTSPGKFMLKTSDMDTLFYILALGDSDNVPGGNLRGGTSPTTPNKPVTPGGPMIPVAPGGGAQPKDAPGPKDSPDMPDAPDAPDMPNAPGPKDGQMGPMDVKKGGKKHPHNGPKADNVNNKPKHTKKHPQDMGDVASSSDMMEQYPWAIVSNAQGTMLFVLARDPVTFQQQYQQIVLQKLQSLGFTSAMTQPIAIPQSADCQYPPAPIIA
eukprot:gene22661-28805_t